MIFLRQRFRLSHRFWLVNFALLVLYGWTLSEETSLAVQVVDEQCTAVSSDRASSIPCPGLAEGYVGLYLNDDTGFRPRDIGPLDWLAPRSAWHELRLTAQQDKQREIYFVPGADLKGWEQVLDEWRPRWQSAALRWQLPLSGEFRLDAELRRPDEDAGILLLEPNGQKGWAFIVSPGGRRGVWWQWRDNHPAEPLTGIPFQKSILSQGQSLLRRLLRAHHGALLLLLAGWMASRLGQRLSMGRLSPAPWRTRLGLYPRINKRYLVVGTASLAFLAAAFIASEVLERLPHVQDSMTYLFQAQTMAEGRLWAPAPALPEFFEQEFMLVENGRWYGKYSPGFPLILALGVLLKVPWLINPLLAALTIPLLYALGKSLYGRTVGLLAAFLALTSPFFLFMSGSMMAHSTELFWVTLFMLGWVQSLKRKNERRWLFAAALALGMAFLTRAYTAAAIGTPFVFISLLAQMRDQGWHTTRQMVMKAGLFAAMLIPFLLLLPAYQWSVTGDPFKDPRLLYWEFDRPGFGKDIGMGFNAFSLVQLEEDMAVNWFYDPSQPPRGHTPARGLYNIEQNWRSLEIQLFGWPTIFTLAFCWLVFLVGRPRWPDTMLLVTAGGVVGAYIFFWSSGIMYGPRYFYAALPAFFLLTARGVQSAGHWIGGRIGKRIVIVLTIGLVMGNILFYLPNVVAYYRAYNFVSGEKVASVEREIRGKGIVFVTTDGQDWWDYGNFFSSNTPWLDGRIVYARDLGDDRNERLASLYPGYQVYKWLDDRLTSLTR